MDVVLGILIAIVILAVAFVVIRWLRNRQRGGIIATPPTRGRNDQGGGE
jgi:hypothetical protein